MDLNPARGARDILAVVFCTPALWEKKTVLYSTNHNSVFRKLIISIRGGENMKMNGIVIFFEKLSVYQGIFANNLVFV